MVRFLGVASLLLFPYSALVASADPIPRVRSVETNDVGAMLLGRGKTCPYAQVPAQIPRGAANQTPSVATTRMVDAVTMRGYAGHSMLYPGAF